MSRHGKSPRLYVPERLAMGAKIVLPKSQAHYLVSVMRLHAGSCVRQFNGEDGEWRCTILEASRKAVTVSCDEKLADPQQLPDIDYLFAPLKSARLDYMAQKATEMGVRRLCPVFTDHTMPSKINLERLRANVIEAAEQCNMIALPQVVPAQNLESALAGWDQHRCLIYCDETAPASSAIDILRDLPVSPLAVLVGPEGGFSAAERSILSSFEHAIPISLGPRIIRADTAAVAALAVVQSVLGDWRSNKQD